MGGGLGAKFGQQVGNGKWVTNKIFFTDAQDAHPTQPAVQLDAGGDQGNQDQQEVVAEVHHVEEVETREEGAVGGQVEGAEGGEEEEDKGEDDEEEDGQDPDALDEMIASGQIKLKASVKQVTSTTSQAGSVDLSGSSG